MRRSRGFRICIAAENLKFMVPVGPLSRSTVPRERNAVIVTGSRLFRGSRAITQYSYPRRCFSSGWPRRGCREKRPASWYIKRKKRASRWGELSMQDGQLRWICWMYTNVKLNARWLRRKCNIQSRSNLKEKSCKRN